MPSSDIRSSETSAQNARGKNFQKFTCSNFHGFVFRGSYFCVLVVGCENRENLDLAKISRYMIFLVGVVLPNPGVEYNVAVFSEISFAVRSQGRLSRGYYYE